MVKKVGKRTVVFGTPVSVASFAAIGGKKEKEGPLGKFFDLCFDDEMLGEDSFEKAESRMQQYAVSKALSKGGYKPDEVEIIFAGDLLNQCIGSTFGLMEFEIPFAGLYGACSTMVLGLMMSSFAVAAGVKRTVAVTSSHFCSSERQFRFPLEYGGQRTPTSQWTATASGAAVVEQGEGKVKVAAATVGKIIDLGVSDANNMGAAMAPAAADTISAFLNDSNTKPEDYDLILTGDLGFVGSELLYDLLEKDGIEIRGVHNDGGMLLYDREKQDVHAGGSGCGCVASALCGHILPKIATGELEKVLVCATGALMSPTSSMQGQNIPSIAHLIYLQH
ncbi:MAG: stage V sporulation protein AD [Clostridia bacterium]|nr:stage V sporulation protein AD [Clostridia bacterium]